MFGVNENGTKLLFQLFIAELNSKMDILVCSLNNVELHFLYYCIVGIMGRSICQSARVESRIFSHELVFYYLYHVMYIQCKSPILHKLFFPFNVLYRENQREIISLLEKSTSILK